MRVQLPEGARAVAMDDSRRYTAGPGDTVNVSPEQAAKVAEFAARRRVAGERFAFGTRRGRVCGPCGRVWNAWSTTCPRCGEATEATGVQQW